ACKVRISDSEDSIINDESNALFTIRPQIILDSPNGGESVYVYNIYRINWTVTADVSQVLIDYSSNNGSSWLPIQSTPYSASVGYYDWFVPGVITNQALIRIRRSGNDAIFDVSDAVFSIETYIVPPLAPENVAISVSGNDLHLSWSPVTQNEWGINIVPESYIIYYNNSGDPNGTYTYLYNTNSTQFTHLGVGMSNPLGFYQVTAVILTRNIPLKGDVDRYLAEHLKPGMTQAETKAILERLTEIK
nr:hypothetical protein [Candidatus Cloacimonadota bacterium]